MKGGHVLCAGLLRRVSRDVVSFVCLLFHVNNGTMKL